MARTKDLSFKEIMLRLVAGADLIEKKGKYSLNIYRKGSVPIMFTMGQSLVDSRVVREKKFNGDEVIYSMFFEDLLHSTTTDKREEIRVFVMYMWKSKKLTVFNDAVTGNVKAIDNYLMTLVHQLIKNEFNKWYSERQGYLNMIDGL